MRPSLHWRRLVVRPALLLATPALAGPTAIRAQAPIPAVAAPGAPAAAVLRGIVFDSLAQAPLADATVQAVRADDRTAAVSTHTDSLGHFQLDRLAPGRYVLGFFHPVLDLLGVELKPLLVDLAPGAAGDVALAVPGPTSAHTTLCPDAAANDSSGAVAGAVRDAETGAPAPDATVVITWSELAFGRGGVHNERRRVPVKVRADGTFLACGVPTDATVEASAGAPGRTSGLVDLTPPARGLRIQQFALGRLPDGVPAAADSSARATSGGLPLAARGTARLAGVVVTDAGAPVRGARVRVWGAAGSTDTGEDGRFALAELPAGTFTVEARAIGRAPTRVAVDLASGRTASLRMAMPKAAAQLDRVVVRGRATNAGRDLTGFLERRKTGFGKYFTAADIERAHLLRMTDLFRQTLGLNVGYALATGQTVVRGRQGCIPFVFLDGALIYNGADELDDLVPPEFVGAIEVYRSGAETPPQFNPTGGGSSLASGLNGGASNANCGAAIVLWTRR